jgi:hypothetical protein
MPATARAAYDAAMARRYPQPHAVVVEPDGRWLRVRLEQFAPQQGSIFDGLEVEA